MTRRGAQRYQSILVRDQRERERAAGEIYRFDAAAKSGRPLKTNSGPMTLVASDSFTKGTLAGKAMLI